MSRVLATYGMKKEPAHMADLDRAYARAVKLGLTVPAGQHADNWRGAVVRMAVKHFADGDETPGNQLRLAREAAGLSRSELATLLGYADKRSISLLESDKQAMPAKVTAWLEGRTK